MGCAERGVRRGAGGDQRRHRMRCRNRRCPVAPGLDGGRRHARRRAGHRDRARGGGARQRSRRPPEGASAEGHPHGRHAAAPSVPRPPASGPHGREGAPGRSGGGCLLHGRRSGRRRRGEGVGCGVRGEVGAPDGRWAPPGEGHRGEGRRGGDGRRGGARRQGLREGRPAHALGPVLLQRSLPLRLLHAEPCGVRLRGDGLRGARAVLRHEERGEGVCESVLHLPEPGVPGRVRGGREDHRRRPRLVDPAGELGGRGDGLPDADGRTAGADRARRLRRGRGRGHDVERRRVGRDDGRHRDGPEGRLWIPERAVRAPEQYGEAVAERTGKARLQPVPRGRARGDGHRGACGGRGRLRPGRGRRRARARLHGLGRFGRRMVCPAEDRHDGDGGRQQLSFRDRRRHHHDDLV